jgi:hypothetical protein
MAKYKNAIFGDITGVIGNQIGSTWLGEKIVKTRGVMTRIGQATNQIINRVKVAFLAAASRDNITVNVKLINKVAMEKNSEPLTGWNRFFKLNMPNITVENGAVAAVAEADLQFSFGTEPAPAAVQPDISVDGRIRIPFGAAELDPNTGLPLVTSVLIKADGNNMDLIRYVEAHAHALANNLDIAGLATGLYWVYMWNQNSGLTKSSPTVCLGQVSVG